MDNPSGIQLLIVLQHLFIDYGDFAASIVDERLCRFLGGDGVRRRTVSIDKTHPTESTRESLHVVSRSTIRAKSMPAVIFSC